MMAPYNQLEPEEVTHIKGLHEADPTYCQIKDRVGLPISTISSVLTEKTKKSKKPVGLPPKLFDRDTRHLICTTSEGQAKFSKMEADLELKCSAPLG
uniref:HTH psq-type domain-containing protein n=1 Tax=Peronospora matthiolae TaxID=2874970 RepID=A0AAV1TR10_9STRA